jgi:2',3'-cyclic-nucleotide 2'-phosphodiesterase/3'-nucleotidase
MPARALPFRILATTDLHAHIYPYDYYADQPRDEVGLARTASLIAKARAEVGAGLLLDNGDFLQGSPLGDHVAQAGHGVHPMIRAMNLLGYDAGTLGNHDFDHGLPLVEAAVLGADFPLVCGNIHARPDSERGQRLMANVPPWVLLDRRLTMPDGREPGLRIGITGVLPPQIGQWAKAQFGAHLLAEDMVVASGRAAAQLRASGADLVIVLAHTGIGPVKARAGMEQAATAIAALPGVDVVIAGHSHLVFPDPALGPVEGVDPVAGTLAGKPSVLAGSRGSHLGVIDLELRHDGQGWTIDHKASAVWPIVRKMGGGQVRAVVNSQSEVLDATYRDHANTLGHIRQPIAETAIALNSFFALLREGPATRIVAEAQTAWVSQALQGGPYAGLPVLSATAPFKAGGRGGVADYTDIPVGPLAMRHLADLYIYPNTISAVRLTGADVADWLEHAAGIFNQLQRGVADQALINPDFPCYNFDTITGLTYRFDLSVPRRFDDAGLCINPEAHRLRDLRLNGQPLPAEAALIIATNSYRAGGGGNFPALTDGRATILESQVSIRDILAEHVKAQGMLRGFDKPGWDFCPLGDTSAVFETSPKARDHLVHGLESLGLSPQGFARFRLRL